MKIIEKFIARQENLDNALPVIAFLGDSVTQGCFELYKKEDGNLETIFEPENSYSRRLQKKLAQVYPRVSPVIINAGISGDYAENGLKRLERDVLRFSPDLTVVSFGLNDCAMEAYSKYLESLRSIFKKLRSQGGEVIFMTENMYCTRVSEKLLHDIEKELAKECVRRQKNGELDKYFESAKKIAEEEGVTVCDVYSIWKTMEKNGIDITALLSNSIHHPTREMNQLFADKLFECIFQ